MKPTTDKYIKHISKTDLSTRHKRVAIAAALFSTVDGKTAGDVADIARTAEIGINAAEHCLKDLLRQRWLLFRNKTYRLSYPWDYGH